MNIGYKFEALITVPAVILSSLLSMGVLAKDNAIDNYAKVITYESSQPFYSPDGMFFVDGIAAGNADNFHKNVMNRTEEQIEANKQEALSFFAQRFGMFIDDPRLFFTSVEVMPEINYRAIYSSGEKVPEAGWQVRDAAWIFAVVDPAGIELGGEFSGIHVSAGTMVAYGEYNIKKAKRKDDDEKIEYIKYRSLRPITADRDGAMILACELSSDKYGEGQALGVIFPFQLSDGRLVMNIRNSLTFPKWGLKVPASEVWQPTR